MSIFDRSRYVRNTTESRTDYQSNHNRKYTFWANFVDFLAVHFKTCERYLSCEVPCEVPRSGNNLFNNGYQLSLYEFDTKLTFHFLTFPYLSFFLSPVHSFWRPEKFPGTIGAVVRYFFHP